MSKAFQNERWPGHDGLARRMSLGWTQAGRELSQLLLLFAVALAGVMLLMLPTGASMLALTVVLAGPVLVCSARATAQAHGAMGALWLAPQAARQQWLRGWWQMQTRVGPALALLGFVAVAVRSSLGGPAWAVAGLVLAAQALGAWSALKPHSGPQRGLFAAALLWLLGLGLLDVVGFSSGIAPWAPWLGVALMAGSAAYLWRLHRRLLALAAGLGRRPQVVAPAFGTGSALLAWAQSWSSLESRDPSGSASRAFQWVNGSVFPMWLLVTGPTWRTGSQWQASQGPAKLWLLGWLVLMISSTLIHRPIHWRQWLRPGGVRRHRLGWHILASTLRFQALAGLFVVALVSAVAWTLGLPLRDIALTTARTWPLLLEWCVAATLAVIWAGLYSVRRSGAWLFALAFVLPSVPLAWLWLRHGTLPTWGTVNELYVAALLAALALLLPLANAVWARADLHRLMPQATVKTHNGWEI